LAFTTFKAENEKKKKKEEKRHCLPKLAIEESGAMSKGFSSFFPFSLG